MVAGHEDEQYLTIFAGKTGEKNGKLGDMGMKMHNIYPIFVLTIQYTFHLIFRDMMHI